MSQSRSSASPWACPGDLLEDLASRYIAVRAEANPDGKGVRIVVSDTLDQLTQQDIAAIAYWGPEIFAIVEEWTGDTESTAWLVVTRGKGRDKVAWSWRGAIHQGKLTSEGIIE